MAIGDRNNYDKQPIDEYRDKYRAFPLERHLSAKEREQVGITLRKTNYALGDDSTNFQTTNQEVFKLSN